MSVATIVSESAPPSLARVGDISALLTIARFGLDPGQIPALRELDPETSRSGVIAPEP